MFKRFFQKRIQKDQLKLEEVRKKCTTVMQAKGLSETDITQVDSIAHKKASIEYVNNPEIKPVLKIYLDTVKSEADKIGYDVR